MANLFFFSIFIAECFYTRLVRPTRKVAYDVRQLALKKWLTKSCNLCWKGIEPVLPVPQFSREIGLVLIRRCGKNLAVAGCGFFGLVFEVTTSVKVKDNCV